MNTENITLDNLLNQTNTEENNQTILAENNQTITEPTNQTIIAENNQTTIEQIGQTISEESNQILNMLSNQTELYVANQTIPEQSNQTVATEPNYKLTTEQKNYVLGNLTELENYGIEYYNYTMSSKLNIAKAFYEEGEVNINNIYKILPTPVNEIEAAVSILQELAPNLTESKLVPLAKIGCTGLSIMDHYMNLMNKLFPSNNYTQPSEIEKNLLPICNEVMSIANIYDPNLQDITKTSTTLNNYIDHPLDIFVLSTIGNTTTPETADVGI